MTIRTEFDTLCSVMHQVIWHPKAKAEIRSFPKEVKDKLGYLIFRVQLGEVLTMPLSRGMGQVANGVRELRVKGKDGIYRSFYMRMDGDKIIVFHAFKKKTQKTSSKDINQGTKNLKEVMEWQNQK